MNTGSGSGRNHGTFRRRELLRVGIVGAGAAGLGPLVGDYLWRGTGVEAAMAVPRATLNFWKFQEPAPRREFWMKTVAAWNAEQPDAAVGLTYIPVDQYEGAKLQTAFAANQGPDVFLISAGDLMRFVNAGITLPLERFLSKDQIDDFLPVVREAVTVNGHIVYLRFELDVLGLYYDRDLLDALNVKPPATWDELIEVASKIKSSGKRPWGVIVEPSPGYYGNFTWYPFLWQGGSDVLDSAWKKATINGAAGANALQLWGDLVSKHRVAPPKIPTLSSDISLLANGTAGMQVCGSWAVPTLRDSFPNFKYGVTALPIPSGGRPATDFGGWGIVASARSRHAEQAGRFAAWFAASTTPQGIARLLQWSFVVKNTFSPRKSVMAKANAEGLLSSPVMRYLSATVYPTGRPEPRFPPEVVKAVEDALQSVMFGGRSGAAAANAAAATINAFLAQYRGAH